MGAERWQNSAALILACNGLRLGQAAAENPALRRFAGDFACDGNLALITMTMTTAYKRLCNRYTNKTGQKAPYREPLKSRGGGYRKSITNITTKKYINYIIDIINKYLNLKTSQKPHNIITL
ncbi:hypothetical protein DAI21_10640 [Lelliottia sp. WB101]|nr:hypothetical protein DAI21_10640 [Lelliottia sp. WB101]